LKGASPTSGDEKKLLKQKKSLLLLGQAFRGQPARKKGKVKQDRSAPNSKWPPLEDLSTLSVAHSPLEEDEIRTCDPGGRGRATRKKLAKNATIVEYQTQKGRP